MVKLTAGKIRELAVLASVDPRTIVRVLNGGPVETLAAERALKAIRDAGIVFPSATSTARAPTGAA